MKVNLRLTHTRTHFHRRNVIASLTRLHNQRLKKDHTCISSGAEIVAAVL